MKNILKIIMLFIFVSCKAQIVPLYPPQRSYKVSGTYYKDEQFDLNKFVGTWRYENGTDSFTIILKKKTHAFYAPDNCYFDMLVGEYEYIEGGTIIVSTISNIDNPSIGDFNHNMKDGYLLFGQRDPLDSHIVIDRGVLMPFVNPLRIHIDAFVRIEYFDEGGLSPTIKLTLIIPSQIFDEEDLPYDFMIKDGLYEMTKIN